ncbi:MAG: phenylacetate--CoA ligase family protein, partial [Abitibacteriaceae bacterium]|nr:phenylacetate--CoA ligase family protein [Abditibacteriaceae bacterium]
MRALPSSFVRNLYFPLAQRYKGERLLQYLQALRRDSVLTTEDLRAKQWQDVRSLVRAARKAPFWAERLRPFSDPISPEDFARLPILTKDDLRAHGDELLVPGATVYQTGSTSGSTGVAITVKHSSEVQESNFACQWHARSWYGVQLGDPGLWVWGRPIYSWKKRVLQTAKARLNNMMLVPSFDLSDEILAQWWPKIKQFRPVYIYGYTSALDKLAEFIEAHDKVDFPVKVVFIAAEQLYHFQRERMSRVFNAPVANEYGCVETGSMAYECPQGSWHLFTEHTYVEFLNDDNTPARPGELGQVVVTTLRNRTMPLIRYRLGDVGGPN